MKDAPYDDAPLDEALRRYYAGQRLAGHRVDRLVEEGRNARRNRWKPALVTGAAAMLLVSLGGLHIHQKRAGFRTAVLTEVAMNHRKNLPPEFEAGSFPAVALALPRLDVTPEPEAPVPGAAVLGARYCSIQGRLAGLIKLDVDGQRHTLYVTSATEELVRLDALEAIHDGVGIRLWSEGDRFFALAGDAEGLD